MVNDQEEAAIKAEAYINSHETMGPQVNPTGTMPNNKFRAIYIDLLSSSIVGVEEIQTIAENNDYLDRYYRNVKAFAAYYVGNFQFDKTTALNIHVDVGWASARIIIDGQLVDVIEHTETLVYAFEKGNHIIKIEIVNDWHTADWNIMFQDIGSNKKIVDDNAFYILSEFINENTSIDYVGIYETSEGSNTVYLNVPYASAPRVLFLNSSGKPIGK